LQPLPEGLAAENACLVETASVSWHGVRLADPAPGERVVVVGGGPIGLMAVAAARARGADVALEARHAHQRAAGERLGATTPSGEYDVVIEAAGSESGLSRCAELARPGGRVVLLGVYFSHVPVPGVPTLLKELSWKGAMAYGVHDGVRDFSEAAALLAETPEIADTLITHRFALDDAAEAFRVANDRAGGAIKVVLHP
jgi:threonine dehydrogenase-like Zn-dependent dehydrogenase